MFPRASVKHQVGLIRQASGGTRQQAADRPQTERSEARSLDGLRPHASKAVGRRSRNRVVFIFGVNQL